MSDEELCEKICQLEKENSKLKFKVKHRDDAMYEMAKYIDHLGVCVDEDRENCDADHCVECIIKHFMEETKQI